MHHSLRICRLNIYIFIGLFAVFCFAIGNASAVDIIIDNLDSASTSMTGTWSPSNGINPYNGNSVWGQNNATFTWHFTCPQTGLYQVYEYHTVASSRTSAAPLTIQNEGATDTKIINQKVAGGAFNLVDTYDFVAGVTYDITVTAAEYSTSADAVGFSFVEGDIIIDNLDSASTSMTGTWSPSNGINPYNGNSVWGQNNATFTWHFTCPQTGLYQVYEYHTVASSRTSAAPLTIQNEGATDTKIINQKVAGGAFNFVATYDFVAGVTYDITVTAAEYSTSADAMMFRLVEGSLPTAIIDSVSAIFLEGHGTPAADINGYLWESSLDGALSDQASFTPNPPLTGGTHTISFKVRNTAGLWSDAATQPLTVGGGTGDIVIDNLDSASTSMTGTWSPSNGINPYNGNSVWGQNNATFTWHFTCPQTGLYQVYEYHTVAPTRTTAAPLTIQNEGATDTKIINQKVAGGAFNFVDTYDFVAGVTYDITVTAAEYSTSADAMMFRLVEGSLPTAIIDSVSAIFLEGHGTPAADINGYLWESSLDGALSDQASFTPNPPLTGGTHTISFKVRNTAGLWSDAATQPLTVGGGTGDIVIDNLDSASTSMTGTWSPSNGINPYNGNSVWGQNNAAFTWHFTCPQTGLYQVYEYHTVAPTRTTAAPLTIQNEGATDTKIINQKVAGGAFNFVDTYDFVAGVTYDITVTAAEYSTSADAMMFRPTQVGVAPTITTQPSNQTVAVGDTAAFNVVATGNSLNYQWRKDGVNIAGGNSAAYTTPATTLADNGSTYDCVVSNTAGSVSSNPATLTVEGLVVAPTITTHPANRTVTVGDTAAFNVVATGTSLNYQWRKNGVNIAGGNSAAYTTPATTLADNGSTYDCVVSNTAGSVTSGAATLTVGALVVAPTITTHPANRTVTVGNTAAFNVVATGNSLNYQWRKNGVNIAGGNSAAYTTPATTLADNGSTYDCVVSNTAGSVTSNAATLTVEGSSSVQHVYALPIFDVNYNYFRVPLLEIGATQESQEIWHYTNAQGTEFIIHVLQDDVANVVKALTSDAYVVMAGHSNYGSGHAPSSNAENAEGRLYDIHYVDDPGLVKMSSPFYDGDIAGQRSHFAPDWQPIYQNGESAIMPFGFFGPRRNLFQSPHR